MQTVSNAATVGLSPEIVCPYLDDLMTFGTTFEQTLQRTELLLERLRWCGLSLNPSKVSLMSISTIYLGHQLTRQGVGVDPAKTAVIASIDGKSLNNTTAVRSFVGLCNYYRRFVRGFAEICAPLHALCKTGVDVAAESQTPAVQAAVTALKEGLCSAPILMLPRSGRRFTIKTDAASCHGIGAVLCQEDDDGRERVISYYGRRLTPAETKYTVTEVELLAIVAACKHWKHYIWGSKFRIITDHAAWGWGIRPAGYLRGYPSL